MQKSYSSTFVMDFECQVAHSVTEIDQDVWDHLSGGRPFTSYRWYHFGEEVLADNLPVYIILSREGVPVARATFWLRRQEALPISSKATRYLLEKALHRWPLLLCQAPLADTTGLILPDPPLRDAALETIAQMAKSQAEKYRASFIVCDYLEEHEARYAGWPGDFVAVQVSEPGTRLMIEWPDFERYRASLSKSIWKDYRRHRNRAADLGLEVKSHAVTRPLDEATVDKAMALIRNVEAHHHSAPYPWARSMLRHAHLVPATWLMAEIGERVVGCGLLLRDGNTQQMKLLGLDYEVQYAYFQVVYAALGCAVEAGVQILRGGSGAYEMKQRLGFQLESNNYVVFAGRGALLQRLGRWVADNVV